MNEATNENAPTVDEIRRAYYAPSQQDEINSAVEYAQQAAANDNIPLSFNFDPNEALPDGYGIATIPVTQRREGSGNVPIGVYIAAIPDPDTIAASEQGANWARDAVVNALLNKFANAVRPRGDNQGLPESAPFTVEDFITSASRDQGLAFFREVGGDYVKALKKMGLRIMNLALFRQVLSSAPFAEQQFPNIDQSKWEGILDKMIAKARNEGKDPGILTVWREQRDNTEINVQDFDLDELDELGL